MAVLRRPYAPPYVVSRSSAISEEKRKRIAQLYEDGLEVTIISERLGLHTNTVHLWLHRLGLKAVGECLKCGSARPKRARCYCEVRS